MKTDNGAPEVIWTTESKYKEQLKTHREGETSAIINSRYKLTLLVTNKVWIRTLFICFPL